MRLISLLVCSAAFVALPAQAREHEAPSIDQVGKALADPQVRAGVATMLDAFDGAILDTRVGPLARYGDKSVRRDDTLRDLARRDDPEFDRKLSDTTRGAVAVAGQAARDGAAMQKELRATAARLRDLFAATSAALDAAGDAGN